MARVIAPGGTFVLSFRDLTRPLTGTDRFILLRSDPDRVMTCFLEYAMETVVVHDLVHIRRGGKWTLRTSSYRKLRLAPDWVTDQLQRCGFTVKRAGTVGRMFVIAAVR